MSGEASIRRRSVRGETQTEYDRVYESKYSWSCRVESQYYTRRHTIAALCRCAGGQRLVGTRDLQFQAHSYLLRWTVDHGDCCEGLNAPLTHMCEFLGHHPKKIGHLVILDTGVAGCGPFPNCQSHMLAVGCAADQSYFHAVTSLAIEYRAKPSYASSSFFGARNMDH